MQWQTSRFDLDLSRPWVMGIVNVTPDSFSDGGKNSELGQALRNAEQMLRQGADILDIGGESTRPGSEPVPLALELNRLVPVLKEVVRWQVPVSVDTYKPEVMQIALDLGVDIINDIWALRQPGAEAVVSAHPRCGVCLMHMHREPQSMQVHTMDGDVVKAVGAFFKERLDAMTQLGVARERLVLDPGIGFGKTVAQNFSLLAKQDELLWLKRPLLAGWSRKSSLGAILTQGDFVPEPDQRQSASVAAALLAVDRGARVVRVHDVAQTSDALKVWKAMSQTS